MTIIINLSFGFYLFIYFYKNTKTVLRRREIQYILSQSGFKHNRIFFYPSYKMRNTFGVLSQNMCKTILLSPCMTKLYSSEVSYPKQKWHVHLVQWLQLQSPQKVYENSCLVPLQLVFHDLRSQPPSSKIANFQTPLCRHSPCTMVLLRESSNLIWVT